MATVVQELHNSDARFDWTGFYRVAGPGMLKLGPFQGGPACTSIPFGRGVCGAAARTGTTQVVPDVDAFADHIACGSTTRSEIVVPVRDGAGTLLGVLDIDSDELDAFDDLDAERLALLLEDTFGRLNAGPAELDIAV
ncbi:GAF domain-containing protein [Jannaschia sp. W003]|nr:GAF domain-containing protein [Jannaschia sp. W003]UWQ23083.1 GAF domain-containing protein [Jannaschia sp. W003]